MGNLQKNYDLVPRVKRFSMQVINFTKTIRLTIYNKNILEQLLKSATSVGANYIEADNAGSVKDYINKTNIARKESAETRYWLELLQNLPEINENTRNQLQQEAKEINLILNAIIHKLKV